MHNVYFIKSISTGKYFLGCTSAESSFKGTYNAVTINIKVAEKYGKHKELLAQYKKMGRKDFCYKFTKVFETEYEALMYCHEAYNKLVVKKLSLNDSFPKPEIICCTHCGEEFLSKYEVSHNDKCDQLINSAESEFEDIII